MAGRPSWADAAIGLGLVAIGQVETWTSAPVPWRALLAVAAAAGGLAMMWRRLYPLAAAAVALAAIVVTAVLPPGLMWTVAALVIAMFSAARHAITTARALVGLAGGLTYCGLTSIWVGTVSLKQYIVNVLSIGVLMVAVPWMAGFSLRERARESREQTAEAVDKERLRIARELHDVISHSLSVIAVQAGAEQATVSEPLPESTRAVLAAIEQASHEALAEMRRLLTVTRGAGEPSADDLVPPRTLAHIESVLQAPRTAGWTVTVRVEGDPVVLAPGVDLAAYRIVQEAVTNAVRHSMGTSVEVTVRYLASELSLEVADGGRGGPSASRGSGFGLVGMRERAALYGGRVSTRRNGEGGFVVEARLPYSDTPPGLRTPIAVLREALVERQPTAHPHRAGRSRIEVIRAALRR
jgi:signal transduction histidine kinase